jgi:uncharacterized membrane protein YqjE
MTDRNSALPRERRTTRRGIPPIPTLIGDLKYQVTRLVRGELALLRAELTEKLTKLASGIGMFAGAAILVFFALGCLISAAVLGLALVLPAWLSAVIIGVALLVIAGVLALVGRQSLKSAGPPLPEKTIASVHADVNAVTHSLKSDGSPASVESSRPEHPTTPAGGAS